MDPAVVEEFLAAMPIDLHEPKPQLQTLFDSLHTTHSLLLARSQGQAWLQSLICSSSDSCAQKSDQLKQQANALVSQKRFALAIPLYSQALCMLPKTPQPQQAHQQSILHTNRCYCQIQTQHHKAALEDGIIATNLNPNNPKAWLRRAMSAQNNGDLSFAQIAVSKGLAVCSDSAVTAQLLALSNSITTSTTSTTATTDTTTTATTTTTTDTTTTTTTTNPSTLQPQTEPQQTPQQESPQHSQPSQQTEVASHVYLTHTHTSGRSLHTTVAITPPHAPPLLHSQAVSLTAPFALPPRPFCAWCLRMDGPGENFVCCPKCCHVMYCSESCRSVHRSRGHAVECGLGLVRSLDTTTRLALLLALLFLKTKCAVDGDENEVCFDTTKSTPFLRHYTTPAPPAANNPTATQTTAAQVTSPHTPTCIAALEWGVVGLSPRDRVEHLVGACAMEYVLCNRMKIKAEEAAWRERFREWCLTVLLRVRINSFTIRKLMNTEKTANTSKDSLSSSNAPTFTLTQEVAVATALFISASFLNHSCSPNCAVHFDSVTNLDGSRVCQLRLIATHDIPAGSPLLISYGPVAGRHAASERHTTLQRKYGFSCRCPACKREATSFRCEFKCCSGRLEHAQQPCLEQQPQQQSDQQQQPQGEFRCNVCLRFSSPNRAALLATFDQQAHQTRARFSNLVNSNTVQALVLAKKHLRLCEQLYCSPHHAIAEAHDMIARASACSNDFATAAHHTQLNCEMISSLFGPHSLELAQELPKLAQMLFRTAPTGQPHQQQQMQAWAVRVERAAQHALDVICGLGLDQTHAEDVAEMREMVALVHAIGAGV